MAHIDVFVQVGTENIVLLLCQLFAVGHHQKGQILVSWAVVRLNVREGVFHHAVALIEGLAAASKLVGGQLYFQNERYCGVLCEQLQSGTSYAQIAAGVVDAEVFEIDEVFRLPVAHHPHRRTVVHNGTQAVVGVIQHTALQIVVPTLGRGKTLLEQLHCPWIQIVLCKNSFQFYHSAHIVAQGNSFGKRLCAKQTAAPRHPMCQRKYSRKTQQMPAFQISLVQREVSFREGLANSDKQSAVSVCKFILLFAALALC